MKLLFYKPQKSVLNRNSKKLTTSLSVLKILLDRYDEKAIKLSLQSFIYLVHKKAYSFLIETPFTMSSLVVIIPYINYIVFKN